MPRYVVVSVCVSCGMTPLGAHQRLCVFVCVVVWLCVCVCGCAERAGRVHEPAVLPVLGPRSGSRHAHPVRVEHLGRQLGDVCSHDQRRVVRSARPKPAQVPCRGASPVLSHCSVVAVGDDCVCLCVLVQPCTAPSLMSHFGVFLCVILTSLLSRLPFPCANIAVCVVQCPRRVQRRCAARAGLCPVRVHVARVSSGVTIHRAVRQRLRSGASAVPCQLPWRFQAARRR